MITSIIGLLGSVVSGFFGLRTEQKQVVSSAINTIQDLNASEKDRAVAYAVYMQSEANSQYWLAACIRPLIALCLLLLVCAWFFGFAPPNLEKAMPPFIDKAVETLMVFIGVYVPSRSFEKIVNTIMTSKVINNYIQRYL